MGTYSAMVITALFLSLASLSRQADVNITVRPVNTSPEFLYILFSEARFMEFYTCLSSTEGRCSANVNITAYPNYTVTNVTTSSNVCHDSNRDICYECSFKPGSSSFVCESDVANCHSANQTVHVSNSSCRSPCIGFAWSIENEGIVSSLDNFLVHQCGTSCDCLSGDNTTTTQKTTSRRPGSSKDETEDDFMMEAIIGAVVAVVLIIIVVIVIIVLCRRQGSNIPDEENTNEDVATNMKNINNAELKNKLELNKTNTIPSLKTDNGTAMKNTTNGNSSLPTGTAPVKDVNKNNITKTMVNKNSAKSDNTKSLAPQNSAKSSDVKKNNETTLVKQNETDQVIANGQPLVSLLSNQSGEKQEVVSPKVAEEDANSVIEINPDPEDDYYGIDENEHEIVAQSSVKKSPVADRINIGESDYDYPIVEIIELQESGDKGGADGLTGGDRTSFSDDFGYSHVPSAGLEKNKTNVSNTKSIGIDHDYDDVSIKSGQVQMKNKTKNDDYDLCTDGDDGNDDGADGHDEEEGPKISGATSEDVYSRLHEDIVREKKNPYDILLHPKEDPKTRKPAPDPTHDSDTTNQQTSMPNTTPTSSVSSSEKPATDPSHDENSTNQETSASLANTAHHDSSTKKETSHSEDDTKEEKTEDSINDKNNEEPSTSKLEIKHSVKLVKGKDDYTLVVRNNEDSNPDSEVEKL